MFDHKNRGSSGRLQEALIGELKLQTTNRRQNNSKIKIPKRRAFPYLPQARELPGPAKKPHKRDSCAQPFNWTNKRKFFDCFFTINKNNVLIRKKL